MKLMKTASILALSALFSTSALAFWWGDNGGTDPNGPYKVVKYSTDYSCDALQEMVYEEGAVVIYESANPPLYKKYVSSDMYCDSQETTWMDYIAAHDGKCALKECVAHSGGNN